MPQPHPLSPRSRPTRWWAITLVLVGLWPLAPHAARAGSEAADEVSLRAAFVYNFIKFTTWPADSLAEPELRVAVLGHDLLRERLARLVEGRVVQGRRVHVQAAADPRDLPRCQVVYYGPTAGERLSGLRHEIGAGAVLTVGEDARFLDRGGVIQLRLVDSRLHFEANAAVADSVGLRLSAQLLQLAEGVRRTRRGGTP